MATESDQPSRYRLVVAKHYQNAEILKLPQCKDNRGNSIKTTKYTIWSFIPKNLFEQFHRFANIYFLFIVCLNWMPAINAFGREIAMLPLIFVLTVTALKDLFEDRRRYNSDKKVNNTICNVYDRCKDQYCNTKWKEVVVGDIVKLSSDEVIPADVLLLNSSDPHDICFIETANLDGETNLKQRETVKGLFKKNQKFLPKDFNSHIQCEQPNNRIYRFHGKVESVSHSGSELSVNNHNLLLRGCVIRNTKWVEGIVVYAGHDTKAMLNNSGPRYKHSKVERDINLDIIACVVILFTICFLCGVGCGLWTQTHSFFNSHFAPGGESNPAMEGFVRFWTFIIIFQVIIPISLYVSAEIAKLGQVYFISQDLELYHEETDQPVICRALNINEDLGQIKYVFSDKTGTLTENKMVFRKCTIGGTNFAHESERPVKNCTDQPDAMSPPLSKSSQDQLCSAQVPTKGGTCIPWDNSLALAISNDCKSHMYEGKLSSFLREFFILVSICNTVVVSGQQASSPSSKDVVEESFNSSCDSPRNENHSKMPSQASTSLTVDQGQSTNDSGKVNEGLSPSPYKTSPQKLNGFFVPTRLNFDQSTTYDDITYEAESPDEAALVKMASSYGFKLVSRSPNHVSVFVPDEGLVTFEVLHVLAFDSTRKRMSVVVRRPPDGEILVYCKGADSVVMERLSRDHRREDDQTDARGGSSRRRVSVTESTEVHLDVYARDGLRTLCMARKELTSDEYQEWLTEHRKAETSLDHRERKLHESAQRLETNLELLGATGIEDRLQDGVPQTIAQLRHAGIKVWVLTGDKQETAVSVSHACKLLDRNMEKIFLNAKSREDCSSQIQAHLKRLHLNSTDSIHITSSTSYDVPHIELPKGLIIDGRTLVFALEKPLNTKFLSLASHCQVVLCCRATPIQKASVVQLVRDGLKVMTLAIGDGANDVSMIQMADVGIGITGQEGMQAVMASDFAIGRFRFLTQLLLVHGHWCYDRITKMFLYFFYKNAMFVFVLFWFQIYNGFSGSNLIDDLSLIFFNLIFTAAPPVVCGILDKDLPASVLKANPHLYKSGQNDQFYTRKSFWIAILDAVYQSVVLFFSCALVFRGSVADDRLVGITVHQAAVIVSSLHMGLITAQWTWIHHVLLWGSVALSFVWTICFGLVQVTHKIYFVSIATLGSKEFWALCTLIAVAALLPRYSFLSLRRTLWPSEIDKAQIKINTKQSPFSPNLVRIDTNTEPPTQVSGIGT